MPIGIETTNFSFADVFIYFEQKTMQNIECGLQKRELLEDNGKLSITCIQP